MATKHPAEVLYLSTVLNYLLTYLLTNVLTYAMEQTVFFFEKLIVFQLVKKFPAFYGRRGFITTFASTQHLSLS